MQLAERIDLLVELGNILATDSPTLQSAQQQAQLENPWFTPSNTHNMLQAIATNYLQANALHAFVARYPALQQSDKKTPKTIGIVMAGNIPLVGFHDLLCVWLSGNRAQIKYASKDKALMSFVVQSLCQLSNQSHQYLLPVELLRQFDAVIATGSDNTNRYFEQYFKSYPHLLRGHRNAVAVLDGTETTEQINALASDILLYFGLGCRNVAKLLVPPNYDFVPLLRQLDQHDAVIQHHKYKNNYDHYRSIFLLDRTKHWASNCLLLTESAEQWAAPISVLYYSYYHNDTELQTILHKHQQKIQCVVGNPDRSASYTAFGNSQRPQLHDYADGIDTMQWLLDL